MQLVSAGFGKVHGDDRRQGLGKDEENCTFRKFLQ